MGLSFYEKLFYESDLTGDGFRLTPDSTDKLIIKPQKSMRIFVI